MSIVVNLPDRLKSLPPYLFAALDRLRQEKLKLGVDVINLGIGDPDLPTPEFIIAELNRAAKLTENHHYPDYAGLTAFRARASKWFAERFQVEIDPTQELLALMGSKDGIAHLPLSLINPGDYVIAPDPGYPVYSVATNFVGGKVLSLPLTAENNFMPNLAGLADLCAKHSPKLLFLNYPNNPTAACADLVFFDEIVKLAKKYQLLVCHDNAYSELYFDGNPSPSFMQAKGAKEVGIEMHSLSKSFNMTGWRIGFAVGHPQMIAALAKVKTNMDSGVFNAVQCAATIALRDGARFLNEQRQVFQKRRDLVANILKSSGFKFRLPQATFYFWVDLPKGFTGMEFCQRAINEVGVVVTPGSGFGKCGEDYFRFTITAPEARLKEAAERLRKLIS